MLPTWKADCDLERSRYPASPEDVMCGYNEHSEDNVLTSEHGGKQPKAFSEGANIEGLVVVRKTGWDAMSVTAQPLHCTPFLYQGRLSVGFEVMVMKVEKFFGGNIEVGLTCPHGEESGLQEPTWLVMLEEGITIGTRVGLMIHIDCSTPEVVVYRNNEPYSDRLSGVSLAELLDKIMELPENSSSVYLNGFEVGASLYGCIGLFGQCAAVRMMHDQLRPFVPEFTPEVYRSLPRPVQSSIVCLFTLQQTESIISLLPSEVVFIVCAFLMMPNPGSRCSAPERAALQTSH
eukprot:TRINITY_DN1127_c0_g1_i7.p1 TRINITY_DN1127_c0_g1~~TRINITY_DN1127_c0_g1_i7.p1  ORF type:complete len:290 (-),score=55.95 TRINITY_DN1127_c0_g1_i7:231-1100(-)